MEKPLQLLLPLILPDETTPLPSDVEERVVDALAALLLQIRNAEKGGEVRDEGLA